MLSPCLKNLLTSKLCWGKLSTHGRTKNWGRNVRKVIIDQGPWHCQCGELGTLNRLKWEGFSPSDWSQNRKSEVCKLTMYWDEVPRLGERGLGSRPFLILYFYSWLILLQLALVCTKFNFSSNSRWQTQFFSKFCICFSVVLFKPYFLGSSRISSPYMYSRKRILTVWSHFLCTQNSTLGMN